MQIPDLSSPTSNQDLIESVERLKNILVAHATGENASSLDYLRLRKTLIGHPDIGPRLPRFVRTCSSLGEFWGYIKEQSADYAGRRKFLSEAFAPILEDLETSDGLISATYEQLEVLGEGGFGVVWKYRHLHLDMLFAFKVFAPSFSDDARDLDRFFREARILFKLRHPDIVRIYDVGIMGRRPFIRMEYCEGQNLNAILRKNGRIPADAARRLIFRLAGALGHAHEQGIVHRDLKPSNVMIGPKHYEQATIRLIDFGLGVFIEKDIVSRVTKTGENIAGSSYTAPELHYEPSLLDPRTDLYSLAAVWYEMLTGRPPTGANVSARLDDIPDLQPEEKELLLACLSDIQDRPSSASAFLKHVSDANTNGW